jgi:hypothetical protein
MYLVALTLALWDRARVRGRSCYDFNGFKVFETPSERRPYAKNLSGGHFENVSDAGPTDEVAFQRNAGFRSPQ